MTTTHCPFCSVPLAAEPNAWRCDKHGSFPRCLKCGNPLNGKLALWCAWCREWFGKAPASPSLYAEAEAQIAALGPDQRIVIHVAAAKTEQFRTLGARGGFAVSAIRDGGGLRKFTLIHLDKARRNEGGRDSVTIEEDQITRIEIEEY